MISWNHARLRREGGRLILEDLGSTNGTAVGQTSNRITQADVQPTDVIFFGSLKVPVSRLLESKKLVLGGEANQETVRMTGTEMVIGRDPDCDYPLKYPMISWRHARLEKTPNGLVIEDLGSKNGTFVDGQQISGTRRAEAGQRNRPRQLPLQAAGRRRRPGQAQLSGQRHRRRLAARRRDPARFGAPPAARSRVADRVSLGARRA